MVIATNLATRGFNPRSPCGERQALLAEDSQLLQFQPTLPLRGATMQRRSLGAQ